MPGGNHLTKKSRSAHDAIRGYEYQFDQTTLKILSADATAVVHIEGIEDIDLIQTDGNQATQVKYYEGQKYASPKSLRDPIRLMLEHYQTGARWQYVLHVHFGQPNDLPEVFTLEQMKTCLTKREQQTGNVIEYFSGLDDETLQDFCDRVAIRDGQTFGAQQGDLIRELTSALACNSEDVHAIYLAKARDFVHERARSADSTSRRVTREDLMQFLSVREILFNRWQLEVLGKDRYIRAQVAHLRRNGFKNTKLLRGISIDLTNENFDLALDIAKELANSHIGRLRTNKPWILILAGASGLIHNFKIELVRSAIHFWDGYESIEFSVDAFGVPPIVNLLGASDRIKSSSYVLRVISSENFRVHAVATSMLARLLVLGEKDSWHEAAATETYVLRDYEPALLRTLIGEVA